LNFAPTINLWSVTGKNLKSSSSKIVLARGSIGVS